MDSSLFKLYHLLFEPYRELSKDDAALIEKILSGDEMAFAYLLIEHCRKEFKYLVNLYRSYGLDIELDELVSEVTIIILKDNDFRTLSRFEGRSLLKTYIYTIALRFLSKKLRKFLKEKEILKTLIKIITQQSNGDNSNSTLADVLDKYGHVLTRREKEVLELTSQGVSDPKIAEHIGTTVGNVHTIRCRAIAKIAIARIRENMKIMLKG